MAYCKYSSWKTIWALYQRCHAWEWSWEKKEIMPTGPLSSAKATSLYRAGLGKLQISQGTAFQPCSSKNPPLRWLSRPAQPNGYPSWKHGSTPRAGGSAEAPGNYQLCNNGSCRAFQCWASLLNLLSLLLTVDAGKSPCPKKKSHVQRKNKGKIGEHWWRRRAFQHNSPQISFTRRVAPAKGPNCQKAFVG